MRLIFEGLALGLSAGVYCLGACLIFFMPYLLAEGKQKIYENLAKISSFLLGRLIAYIIFALVLGFLGAAYKNIFTARFSHICLIIASLLMLSYCFAQNFTRHAFCANFIQRFSLLRIPFFLGLFTGLNPCPPFLVGATRLWTLHSIAGGVILFVAFFLGTSVYIFPLVFVAYLNKSARIKQIGLMVALLSGLWFLFVGIAGLLNV